MTSDKTGNTEAYNQLQFALGKKRVKLSDLHPVELTNELNLILMDVQLKDLRGFKPIRELLTRNGDEPVSVSSIPHFHVHNFLNDDWCTLNTQAIVMHSGVLSQTLTYSRHESTEITTDYQLARSWGKSAYLSEGKQRILVLTRPSHHARASESLAVIDYEYTKIPHEKRYVINTITATSVTVASFCSFFERKASDVAKQLIWELNIVHSRTLDELNNQTARMQKEVTRWERISNSIG